MRVHFGTVGCRAEIRVHGWRRMRILSGKQYQQATKNQDGVNGRWREESLLITSQLLICRRVIQAQTQRLSVALWSSAASADAGMATSYFASGPHVM